MNAYTDAGQTDLQVLFDKYEYLSDDLKSNLTALGLTSLDLLLLMDDSQILMYGNLDRFDPSLSTQLILLTGAIKKYKQENNIQTVQNINNSTFTADSDPG